MTVKTKNLPTVLCTKLLTSYAAFYWKGCDWICWGDNLTAWCGTSE